MKTGIKVFEAMTRNPVTASPDENIQECSKKMCKDKVGSIVIKEKDKLVGIISEKDIVSRVVCKALDPKKLKAKDIMTTRLVTIKPDLDIYDALVIMGNKEIRKLPVVENSKLIGFLTVKDILKIQPALFEIFSKNNEELREESRKPLNYMQGICDLCGSQGPVQKIKNKYVCNSCK